MRLPTKLGFSIEIGIALRDLVVRDGVDSWKSSGGWWSCQTVCVEGRFCFSWQYSFYHGTLSTCIIMRSSGGGELALCCVCCWLGADRI